MRTLTHRNEMTREGETSCRSPHARFVVKIRINDSIGANQASGIPCFDVERPHGREM